jgi:hypothetical protein
MRASRVSRRVAVWAMLALTGCGQVLGLDGDYGDAPAVEDGGTLAKGPAEDSAPAQGGDDVNAPADGGDPIDNDGEAGSQSTIPVDAGGFDAAAPPPGAPDGAGAKDSATDKDGGTDAASAPPDGASADAAPDQPDGAITPASIAHVQNVVELGSGTSMTGTFSSAVKAGDLLVGVFRGIGTVSVSDSVNGSWTEAFGLNDDYLFYYEDSAEAGASSLVITVKATTSDSLRMSVDEFSGVAKSSALDTQSTGSNSGGTSWNAGTTSSVAAGELVYVGAGTAGNDEVFTALSTAGVALTVGGQATSASNGAIFSAYVLSCAAGVQNAGVTLAPSSGSGINGGQIVFRP